MIQFWLSLCHLRQWYINKTNARDRQEILDLIKQAEEQAEKIISEAKEQAHAKRTEILDGTQKEIADMVTAATEKMLSKSTASDAFDQFLAQTEGSGQDE